MRSYCRLSTKFSKLPTITALLFTLLSFTVKAQPNGELLFKGNCASCHRATTEALTGPGLKGVQERWAGREELLYQWIQNPKKVLDSGDPYVTKLYAEYKSSGIMTPQSLSKDEIDAVLAYVQDYQPPVADVSADETATTGSAQGDSTSWFLIIAVLLIVIIFSVVGVKRSMQIALAERKGETYPDVSYGQFFKEWMNRHKILTAFIIIFIVVGGIRDGYHGLTTIGVYQGYKPEQPIWFSHKIHAGQNEINCVYCHNSAEKSKHAGIPTANVCMNCHSAISKGKVTGEKEIAKIYDAVGWDPEARAYTGEEKPIKWVKVHNLPDHVYFNHSQHVVVGKLECQECHGEIQETMDVAEQHAPLTMGWCIDCHRTKEVQMAGNGYYDEIHNRLSKKELKKYLNGDETITVMDLGGLECSKCHY